VIHIFTNAKHKGDIHHKHLLFISLFVIVLFASLSVYRLTVNVSASSLEEVVHVGSETELRAAINNAPLDTPIIVVLDKDIKFTRDSLVIGANQDITLTSNNKTTKYYRLFGAENKNTIIVEGKSTLKLDGIVITHVKNSGGTNRGVYVEEDGCLILYSGEITDNILYAHDIRGGGVYNLGVFEMYGGKISKNYVSNYSSGGGVYNDGIFTMYGGEITNNTAIMKGGGVCNTYRGTFTMQGGKITDNDGGHMGGGVWNAGIFDKRGGNISGNTAAEGNNVYPIENNNWLSIPTICVGVMCIVAIVVGSLFLYFKKYKK
jgi:hypothetical protein